jgi:hypothetical protein
LVPETSVYHVAKLAALATCAVLGAVDDNTGLPLASRLALTIPVVGLYDPVTPVSKSLPPVTSLLNLKSR